MANLGPMTARFSRPAACANQADVYYLGHPSGGAYFFQGPMETQRSCYPPNYNPATTAFYSPAALCPSGYTSACQSLNQIATLTETVITCCPSIRGTPYVCQTDPAVRLPWQQTLACVSVFPKITNTATTVSTSVLFSDLTIITSGTTRTSVFRQPANGGDIGAFGILLKYQSTDLNTITTDPSSATTPTSTGDTGLPTETGGGGGGGGGSSSLSAGASAGIGIGVALGVIFIALGAFFVWRRKRRAGYGAAASTDAENQHHGATELGSPGSPYGGPAGAGGMNAEPKASSYYANSNHTPGTPGMGPGIYAPKAEVISELPQPQPVHEMPADERYAPYAGQQTSPREMYGGSPNHQHPPDSGLSPGPANATLASTTPLSTTPTSGARSPMSGR